MIAAFSDNLLSPLMVILAAQAVITVSAALMATLLCGAHAAASAAIGGVVAMSGALALACRVRTMVSRPGLAHLAAERLALHLAMFVLALGVLRLSPVPMLSTFAVAQLGYLAAFRVTPPTFDGTSP